MKFFCPDCAHDFVADTNLVEPVECPSCTTRWEIDSQGPKYAWITCRADHSAQYLAER